MDQMSETPHRGTHHRRAHSDTTFRFDDFLLFDPSDIDLSSLDLLPSHTPPRVTPMTVDSDDSSASRPHAPPPQPPKLNHLRSLSVDSDFFDSFDVVECGEKKRGKHGHSNSIDGCSATSFEAEAGNKKALDADRLSELALIDPKRAKRILANRQSAARSKERKIRYTSELERKVQTLQTEATTLSAKVTLLQRDTTGLTTENKELKIRLQAMEQQAQLRDALNEALKEEVQRLRIAAGQVPAVNESPFQRATPQFSPHQPAGAQFGSGHQAHQSQQQFHAQQSPTNSQPRQEHQNSSFANFGQKF